MSLATLARKTRAKQKLRKRGQFILNMTGRGNVLGMNSKMSRGNCGGKFTKCAGKRSACCVGVGEPECCRFPHGGKPAPQMGYGVYLNRKSKGAYHPGGGPQCCTKTKSGKIVWKQSPSIDAETITIHKRDVALACETIAIRKRAALACNPDVFTGKKKTCVPDCAEGVCCCPVKKNMRGCRPTDLTSYTRINKSFGCGVTKTVPQSRTAAEQIARTRANANNCALAFKKPLNNDC